MEHHEPPGLTDDTCVFVPGAAVNRSVLKRPNLNNKISMFVQFGLLWLF